ncbi:MAG: hypothetical protein GY906_38980 [bacterium]|nr:hypothetical protein [bacterium]
MPTLKERCGALTEENLQLKHAITLLKAKIRKCPGCVIAFNRVARIARLHARDKAAADNLRRKHCEIIHGLAVECEQLKKGAT